MALLHQVEAVLIILHARRQEEVDVPEVGECPVVKARKSRRASELEADVAVAADDRKTGKLVTAVVERHRTGHLSSVGAGGRDAWD
jgi:hypothetical protein